jgi:AraC-like DNA-binding protein
MELIESNLDGELRLSNLAEECGLSTSYFSRSFKRTFGMPAHRYLITRRVERAKVLLSETNSSLVEVAAHTGFSDQPAFTRTFAKVVGATPAKWRREHSRRGGFVGISNCQFPQPYQ